MTTAFLTIARRTCALLAALVGVFGALAAHAAGPTALRSKLLDTVTTISATETDSTIYDTRGWTDVQFDFAVSAVTGGDGSNYFTGEILGCDTETGTFVPVPGLATGKLNSTTQASDYSVPASSVTTPVVLPRFIKVRWTETGTITGFTATCRARYNRSPDGGGRQYQAGYQGG